jgi:hypothetical protein
MLLANGAAAPALALAALLVGCTGRDPYSDRDGGRSGGGSTDVGARP